MLQDLVSTMVWWGCKQRIEPAVMSGISQFAHLPVRWLMPQHT